MVVGAFVALCSRNEKEKEETRQRLGQLLERRGELRQKKSAREKKKSITESAIVKF